MYKGFTIHIWYRWPQGGSEESILMVSNVFYTYVKCKIIVDIVKGKRRE